MCNPCLLYAPNAVQGNLGSKAGQHHCALLVIIGFNHANKAKQGSFAAN
jgi:hypothetical protein